MKTVVAVMGFSLAAAQAAGVKPCEELKTEIVAKLEAKGVKNYQLDIVAAADVKDQSVVGSCEGGSKKITYRRGEAGGNSAGSQAGKSAASRSR